MIKSEQTRLLDDLRGLQYKMTPADRDLYASLVKRDKDDEDLDNRAAQQLRDMHDRYKPPKSKADLEKLFLALA